MTSETIIIRSSGLLAAGIALIWAAQHVPGSRQRGSKPVPPADLLRAQAVGDAYRFLEGVNCSYFYGCFDLDCGSELEFPAVSLPALRPPVAVAASVIGDGVFGPATCLISRYEEQLGDCFRGSLPRDVSTDFTIDSGELEYVSAAGDDRRLAECVADVLRGATIVYFQDPLRVRAELAFAPGPMMPLFAAAQRATPIPSSR